MANPNPKIVNKEMNRKHFQIPQITPIQQKGLFLLSLLMVCFLGGQYATTLYESTQWSKPAVSDQGIFIELLGEVNRPGLFTYAQQPTIQQVIQDGGGIVSNQSLSWTEKTKVLAQDSSLTIPPNIEGVLLRSEPLSIKALWILGRPIPLNRAAEEDLGRLPGIGPGLARRIVECREARGGFSSLEELKEVRGLKEKTFKKIIGYLTL
jgi:competence protein ComEA